MHVFNPVFYDEYNLMNYLDFAVIEDFNWDAYEDGEAVSGSAAGGDLSAVLFNKR